MSRFQELEQDLWTVPADATVITTNGYVKKSGEAVMGRGCALEAVRNGCVTAADLGARIRERGNRVHVFRDRREAPQVPGDYNPLPYIVAFPVKHQWFEAADLKLISKSTEQLQELASAMGWKRVVLPRPGCGNGGLSWSMVRSAWGVGFLDERFIVVHQPGDDDLEEVDV